MSPFSPPHAAPSPNGLVTEEKVLDVTKILCWNSRGLGNPRGIRSLHALLQREDPNLLFLQETKLLARKMVAIKLRMGYENCLGVECDGRGGSLALMWHKDTELSIMH